MTRDEYKDLGDDQILAGIQQICTSVIDQYARELDPAVPAVLAAHLTGANAVYSGSERSAMIGTDPVLMTGALANPAFDYVALGHIHKHQDLNKSGSPHVVYSGSIERIDFGEERERKGFCIVTINGNGRAAQDRTTTYEFVETPARRFVTIQVDVAEDEDPTEAIVRESARCHLEDAVVRVIYRVSESQQQLVDLRRVRSALEGAFLVSSILPKLAPVERLRRVDVCEDLGVHEALDRYVDNHPELEYVGDDMKRYAAALEAELEASGALVGSDLEEP
jgi:exonuclease SbcD